MDQVKQVLNRRNCKRKADCYERPNRRRLNDEYFVDWMIRSPSWVKLEKLITLPGGKQEVKKFERNLKTYHKCMHLKDGRKPISITAMGNCHGQDIFHCLFLGYEETAPVMADTIYEYCPELAIRFFEKKLKIRKSQAIIEIPRHMRTKVARFYNKYIEEVRPNYIQNSRLKKKSINIDNNKNKNNNNNVNGQHISNDDYYMIEKMDLKNLNKDESKLWEQQRFNQCYGDGQNEKPLFNFTRDFMFRQKILADLFSIDEVD